VLFYTTVLRCSHLWLCFSLSTFHLLALLADVRTWWCIVLREIDFLLKIVIDSWLNPCLFCLWSDVTWIQICTSLSQRKKMKAEPNRLIPLKQGFPTGGTCTCTPRDTFCLSEGVHLRLAIEEKNIFTYPFFPNIYTYISEWYIQKSLYAYCQIHLWIIVTKYFVMRNFRGTCSSVEILKGYMVICWNAEGVHAHLSEW